MLRPKAIYASYDNQDMLPKLHRIGKKLLGQEVRVEEITYTKLGVIAIVLPKEETGE